jgi:quinol monooxygenase YgiN
VIIGTVRITPPPERRADVLEVLHSVLGRIQDQSGCIGCHVYEEGWPEPAIVFVERWTSEAALEIHLGSDVYVRVLAAIELSGDPPDIRFEHVSATEGIEVIERSRRASPHTLRAEGPP